MFPCCDNPGISQDVDGYVSDFGALQPQWNAWGVPKFADTSQLCSVFFKKILGIFTPTFGKDYIYTLPKTNIAPENRPYQEETSTPTIHFQVLC